MGIFKKGLVSLFIAVHCVMMFTSALPDRSVVGDRILQFLAPYHVFFGLDQTWSMFAPNPSAMNSYLDAVITFADGSTERWTFPRASQIDGLERFTAGERYRKYQQENLVPMENAELWFDLSRFVERDVNTIEKYGRGRQFAEVHFYRHYNVIMPPTEVFIPHGQLSKQFTEESVFHYKPQQGVRHEVQVAR